MKIPDRKIIFFTSKTKSGAKSPPVCRRHKIAFENLRRAEHGESIVFLIDEASLSKFIFRRKKLCSAKKRRSKRRARIKIPKSSRSAKLKIIKYLITTQIEGELMTRDLWLKLGKNEQISILSQLADGLQNCIVRTRRKLISIGTRLSRIKRKCVSSGKKRAA
jgi:hypothetical protein